MAELLRAHAPAVALVGAGLSTDSGIPDYRGHGRAPRKSIEHRQFVSHAAMRARYWARSFVGWARFCDAQPNPGHRALAALEAAGLVRGVITQNVDGLHQAAGSRRVVELHGALSRVRCLGCRATESRADLQTRLAALNPGRQTSDAAAAPDGDADLDDAAIAGFVVPSCTRCDGVLKPDVVFFGDNVPAPVTRAAFALLDEARSLLVLGSSLAVWSGLRFVKRAAQMPIPVAIINRGPTRGDPLATLRIDGSLGELLPNLVRATCP